MRHRDTYLDEDSHLEQYGVIKNVGTSYLFFNCDKIKLMAAAGIDLSCHLGRMLLSRTALRITHVVPSA